MMERLFAVGEQREIFLLLTACGFVWGAAMDAAAYVKRRIPCMGVAAEAAAALLLLAMLVGVLMRTHEGVRLYGILGVAIGAMLYLAGVSRVLHAASGTVKKALRTGKRQQEKQGL